MYEQGTKVALNIIKFNDYDLYVHSKNVGDIYKKLIKNFKLENPELAADFVAAAYLHDIGKIFIPNLNNLPIKFTNEQKSNDFKNIMSVHTTIGKQILIDFDVISAVISEHHSSFKDYEDKYCKDVEFGITLLRYVDILCALKETRPYKESWNYQDILQYLQQYDEFKDLLKYTLEAYNYE